MVVAAKWKNVSKTRGDNIGLKTTFTKSSNIFLHDNESFRPKKLNIKIKKWNIFSYAKRIFRIRLFCAEKFKFLWKMVTEIDLQNRQVFFSNFEFCRFLFIFRKQSQVFTTTGQKYDRYKTTSKKIRPLALKCAKFERFKAKRHKFVENLPI